MYDTKYIMYHLYSYINEFTYVCIMYTMPNYVCGMFKLLFKLTKLVNEKNNKLRYVKYVHVVNIEYRAGVMGILLYILNYTSCRNACQMRVVYKVTVIQPLRARMSIVLLIEMI